MGLCTVLGEKVVTHIFIANLENSHTQRLLEMMNIILDKIILWTLLLKISNNNIKYKNEHLSISVTNL